MISLFFVYQVKRAETLAPPFLAGQASVPAEKQIHKNQD
jgi:hypothetical protein